MCDGERILLLFTACKQVGADLLSPWCVAMLWEPPSCGSSVFRIKLSRGAAKPLGYHPGPAVAEHPPMFLQYPGDHLHAPMEKDEPTDGHFSDVSTWMKKTRVRKFLVSLWVSQCMAESSLQPKKTGKTGGKL